MKSYVFVGTHPDTLNPGGTPLAIGQVVKKIDLDDPHNQRLVTEGWLVEQDQPAPDAGRGRPRQNPDSDPEA